MIKRTIPLVCMIVVTLIAIVFNHNKVKKFNVDILTKNDVTEYSVSIDLSRPVRIYHVDKGEIFIQYQTPNSPQGNFYARMYSTPTELGISSYGYDPILKEVVKKEKRTYQAVRDFDVLCSYSAPVVDDWSTPDIETRTRGHALQYFTRCKNCFELQ
jgi:hypothetical protein